MDQDQLESLEVFDPVQKCHYRVLVPYGLPKINDGDSENVIIEEHHTQNITTWSQTETLALINIFSLHKHRFKDFKKRKDQWNLISEELSKIGVYKVPEKCEIKWKNLLRIYRQHKNGNKGQGKFEFLNELDDIVANDPAYRYIAETANSSNPNYNVSENSQSKRKSEQIPSYKKMKCTCEKSEKQKRHEDRMALMSKKMEIEERKVKAFEEYLQFLKSNRNDS